MVAGMKNGEMRLGPFSSSVRCSRSITSNPPMPLPMYTPTRSAFSESISEAGLSQREFGGRDAELDKAAHFLDFFAFDEAGGIEILYLAGDAASERGGVELFDPRDAVAPFANGLPGLVGANTERAQ